jgi:histone acetyltransferase (RNA polymerase elongator complex component)
MTIPLFLPEAACPHRCVFCNQHVITGKPDSPSVEEIRNTITTYLKTKRESITHVEVGCFGGSFTGLPDQEMLRVLGAVQPWIAGGEIRAIRVSTRPDYITEEKLRVLKAMHVTTIELGVQSHFDRVLEASGRGHTAAHTQKASAMILHHGFRLGHQLMIGLPGEKERDEVYNAEISIRQEATDIRIYPLLVLKGTELALQYEQGIYHPLSLETAITKARRMAELFENAGRNIIKIGLHPAESFAKGDLLAGPWHPNFREQI